MDPRRWAALLVLLLAGTYMLIWHKNPLPGNHETVGLGENHVVHSVVGIVLLAAAGYVWYSARRKASARRAE